MRHHVDIMFSEYLNFTRISNTNNERLGIFIMITILLVCSSVVAAIPASNVLALDYSKSTQFSRFNVPHQMSPLHSTEKRENVQHLHLSPSNNDLTTTKSGNNQYIIVLKNGSSASDRSVLINKVKMNMAGIGSPPQITHEYNHVFKGFSIRIPFGDSDTLRMLYNTPSVYAIESDQRIHAVFQPLPTGIDRVDGDLSPTQSGNGVGSVNVDIAIIDSGVDLDHPDLNVYREKTFVSGTTTADDDNGHGTHVAGIAAAKDNNFGVVGAAPGVRIWAIKVLDSTGSGFISDAIAAIDYLTNAGEVEVANMSFACPCRPFALDAAINNSVSKGITYVAAAGNDGMDASFFSPANNVNVITVSAVADTDGKCGEQGVPTPVGNDDSFASFSNFGSPIDIAAPGVFINSTFLGGSYEILSGTSMSAPHVAGGAALHKSIVPSLTPSGIKTSLIISGSPSNAVCDGNGHGPFFGDPDTQHEPLLYLKGGPIPGVTARPTNNIVSTNSFYDVVFVTTTAGPIKRIQVTFPAGTIVPTGASLQ